MDLLTVRETADLLKVSPMTIRRYITGGRLAAVKVGKGVRVNKEAIDHLVQPVTPSQPGPSSRRRGHPFTMADPLWTIVGMVHSEGPGDVSERKQDYLAEAIDQHRS